MNSSRPIANEVSPALGAIRVDVDTAEFHRALRFCVQSHREQLVSKLLEHIAVLKFLLSRRLVWTQSIDCLQEIVCKDPRIGTFCFGLRRKGV